MGLFGTSDSAASSAKRRPGASTRFIADPAAGTTAADRPVPDEAQERKYDVILEYLRSKDSELSDDERFYLTRDQILRFCRATKWETEKTKARVDEVLRWRREYGVYTLGADDVEMENATGKQVVIGWDNSRRPCLYLYPGRQNTPNSKRQIQCVVFLLERVVDLMPLGVENMALLVNFHGATGGKVPSLGQGREVLGLLQTYYAETLGRAFVINIPWFVNGFFTFITKFMDPVTREKLKFNQDLNEYVPPAQLDDAFSGKLVFDYVHEDYWPSFVAEAKRRRQHKWQVWERAGKKIGISEDVLKRGMDSSSSSTGHTAANAAAAPGQANGHAPAGHAKATAAGPSARANTTASTDAQSAVDAANAAQSADLQPVAAVYVADGAENGGPQLLEAAETR